LLQATANNAFFSINYSAEENHPALMTSPVVFKEAPNAEQVADIYARLSGISPLLSEGCLIVVCFFGQEQILTQLCFPI
jgi:hypothetical protein